MPKPLIFLASASPRRSELLHQVGLPHRVRAVDIDETRLPAEPPPEYVRRLALAKAQAVWDGLDPAVRLPVLAADTTVALGDEIFGKPADRDAARRMLGRLSGVTHDVHTAVALVCTAGADVRLNSSTVRFRTLSQAEIDWLASTDEPADKAGAYAIQGRAALFVSRITGSYSGVMGLPLFETWELLRANAGVELRGWAA